MIIITYKKVFFALTAIIAGLAVASLLTFGLRLGIDFTGGTLIEVRYEGERPSAEMLASAFTSPEFEGYSLRETGDNGYILRAGFLSNETRGSLQDVLSAEGAYSASITRLTEVGPTIGKELRSKALVALAIVLLAILLFIAFVFRKVSEPVSSWIYGLIALVTLVFDVIVPVGFFAAVGHFLGASADTLFVTAVLTILGYSVHDTIVVFDRTRENLRLNMEAGRKEPFSVTAGKALNQTIVRSLNTSVTTGIALLALFFFGPESTQDFALTLLVGIAAGTYSSIALATPLLVWVEERRKK